MRGVGWVISERAARARMCADRIDRPVELVWCGAARCGDSPSESPIELGFATTLFNTGNYANSTGYSTPAVDKLLDQGNSTDNRDARRKIYAQIEQQVVDDAPYVWIFYPSEDAPMRTTVQNYAWIPDSVPRYWGLWLAS